jgi:tetratricopeptide (TPR) repeat protein
VHGQARELFARLVIDYPRVPVYRKELGNTYYSIGAVYTRAGELDQAEAVGKEAVEQFRQLVADYPDMADYRADLGRASGNVGWLLMKRHQPARARAALEEARGNLEAAMRANPKNGGYLQALHKSSRDLVEVLLQLKNHGEAAKVAAALPDLFANRAPDYYLAARYLSRCTAAAATDPRLPEAGRQAAVQDYGNRALDLLQHAVRLGATEVRSLANEHDFDPLRARERFQVRLAEIEASARSGGR